MKKWGFREDQHLPEAIQLTAGRVNVPSRFSLLYKHASDYVSLLHALQWLLQKHFPAWLRSGLFFCAKCFLPVSQHSREKKRQPEIASAQGMTLSSSLRALHTAWELRQDTCCVWCLCRYTGVWMCRLRVQVEASPVGGHDDEGDSWTLFACHLKAKAALHRSWGGEC